MVIVIRQKEDFEDVKAVRSVTFGRPSVLDTLTTINEKILHLLCLLYLF